MQIKTVKQILNDMALSVMSKTTKLTNFVVGSVIRSLLEAVSLEIESLYFHISEKFDDNVQTSLFSGFGFDRRPALKSTGAVTLGFRYALQQNTSMPAGYQFYTVPIQGRTVYFTTVEDVVFPVGSTSAVVNVICTEAGIIGNVPSRSIRSCSLVTGYISEVYNEQPFYNGMDEETLEECQRRFSVYIDSLGKGTMPAVEKGCYDVSGVQGVHVVEDIGSMTAYVHDANGNLPSAIKIAVEDNLINYRPGGIPVYVNSVSIKLVDVQCTAILDTIYSHMLTQVQTAVSDAIYSYLNSYKVAKPLYISDLAFYIKKSSQVPILYVDIQVPTTGVTVNENELIRSGIITVDCQTQ